MADLDALRICKHLHHGRTDVGEWYKTTGDTDVGPKREKLRDKRNEPTDVAVVQRAASLNNSPDPKSEPANVPPLQ